MSADSSKRQSKQAITGHVILPQPVNDPSIIDSVAGFIHEVVPQVNVFWCYFFYSKNLDCL